MLNHLRIPFHPRLFDELKHYNRTKFLQDLTAGLTVGIIALPLAMAFAIASGVTPASGIFTAIIAGFLISALGGTRLQIGGPAGAFIVIIYGIIEQYGLTNLFISTLCAGVLLFLMGACKLGSWIRFIPISIVIGFTNGIAVLIALSQIKDFFGLQINKMPSDFFAQIQTLALHIHTADFPTLMIGCGSLLIVFGWPLFFNNQRTPRYRLLRILHIIPGSIIALTLSSLAVSLWQLPVETIGSRFGGIPQTLPQFAVPTFSWILVKQLFAPTLTIALLGAIESLLCARVADCVTHDRHNPNQELMAQGIANFIVPFFGGLPATGTIARTMTNVRLGAASPISGMIHAIVLLLIVLIAAPLAKNIPLTTLAAILFFVAFNMGEWRAFAHLKHFAMTYRTILVTTFLLTVIVDLTVAVETGLLLSCLFFIYRISSLTKIELIPEPSLPAPLPPHTAVYRIFGSLFFGAIDKLEVLLEPTTDAPNIIILELHQLINLDTTGLDVLQTIHQALLKKNKTLILCSANKQPLSLMKRSYFLQKLTDKNYFNTLHEALDQAKILAQSIPLN